LHHLSERWLSPVESAFLLARAYRIVGDMERDRGNIPEARSAWAEGLAAIPPGVAEQPDEMEDHALLLQHAGRDGEAQRLTARLRSIGYRTPM